MAEPRIVVLFSAGAASAVAAKITLAKYDPERVHIVRCVIPSEHPDNDRFAKDCVKWFNHPVIDVCSDRYKDTWDVWEKRRFLNGPRGALCTTELKKMVRHEYQRADDIQVFGYTEEEQDRADQFRRQNFEVVLETPLIDQHLTKADCLAMIRRSGIELPAMYRMGYRNNNCIGCVKGGMGYWNKIRVDFPETFERMAKLERSIGHSAINGVFLDELQPGRGHYTAEPDIECGILCYSSEQTYERTKP
jgi:hypothetical protein